MKLIALKQMKYGGKSHEKGDEFEVQNNQHARTLKAIRRAAEVPAVAPVPAAKPMPGAVPVMTGLPMESALVEEAFSPADEYDVSSDSATTPRRRYYRRRDMVPGE